MTPKKRSRLVGYCRVSTQEQAQEGASIAAQRAKVRAYCELHELELVETFVDEGLSAKTLDRPELQRALALLRSGQADGLLVTKLDRLTRKTRDVLDLVEDLCTNRGLALVSIAENLDTSSAAGRFFVTMLGALSTLEREQIGERTREVLKHLRREKVRMGAAGLGWRYADERDAKGRRVVEVVPAEARVVRRIHDLYGRGYSLHGIAAWLNEERVPTKRGGKWHANQVRRALGLDTRTPARSKA